MSIIESFPFVAATESIVPLQANIAAIVVVIGLVLAIVVLVLLARRRAGREGLDKNVGPLEAPTAEAARPKQLPASKESFAPLPPVKAPEKVVAKPKELTPDDADEAGEGEGEVASAWELADDDDAAVGSVGASAKSRADAQARAKSDTEAKARAEEKVREADAKKRDAEEKAREADAKRRQADEAMRAAAGTSDEEAKARATKAAEGARLAAEQQKKAEQEARAEAARAAEARDIAVKEADARAKAEAKAAGEAEAKAKTEVRRKEAEAKAKADAETKAKTDAEEAKKRGDKKVSAEDEGPAKTLKDGLGRTRKEGFIAKLTSLFAGKQIDQDLLDEVEEALFTSDIGVRTAERLLAAVREALSKKELKDPNKVWEVLRGEAQKILEGATAGAKVGVPKPGEPFVTMVLGVNGTGKTTSIGKMAHKLIGEGRSVVLVAGDTFRAAATEQLEHWARRVGAPCIRGKEGADPASVVFDGVKQAVLQKAEFVLVDTAGRLHNNTNLMEELKKVRRVMSRAIESAPHEVLMVLDATTGQNGITQAKLFKDATDVTGIILTKLDGTAKGGVVLGVCDELKIPIKWVGVGERVADLRVFDPKEFVDELFSPPT